MSGRVNTIALSQQLRVQCNAPRLPCTALAHRPLYTAQPVQNAKCLSRWLPYAKLARLDKPTGTLLLFFPCSWSLTMAAYANTSIALPALLSTATLFAVGAFVMRGAGCTINDLWDRNLDKKVMRTKDRPLASGVLAPRQAIMFLAMQLSTGLVILTQLNTQSILFGASSLLFVVAYPLMKRITHWPQLFLGLTFNWGALLGWLALTNEFNLLATLPLYLSGIMWTLLYDTIYALQDRDCDKTAGILSSARSVEGYTKVYLSSFGIGHVLMLGVAGIMNEQALPFFVVSVGGSAMHVLWQVWTLDEKNKKNAGKIFSSNWILGGLVLLGICLDLGYKRLILEGGGNHKETVQDLGFISA